jgi:hypothetical protein
MWLSESHTGPEPVCPATRAGRAVSTAAVAAVLCRLASSSAVSAVGASRGQGVGGGGEAMLRWL